jgi:hypothetical protein
LTTQTSNFLSTFEYQPGKMTSFIKKKKAIVFIFVSKIHHEQFWSPMQWDDIFT